MRRSHLNVTFCGLNSFPKSCVVKFTPALKNCQNCAAPIPGFHSVLPFFFILVHEKESSGHSIVQDEVECHPPSGIKSLGGLSFTYASILLFTSAFDNSSRHRMNGVVLCLGQTIAYYSVSAANRASFRRNAATDGRDRLPQSDCGSRTAGRSLPSFPVEVL